MNRRQSPAIDFHSIRPQRGTQHGGFEELCVSLFRQEVGLPFSVVRVDGAGGDGGLEAYARDKGVVGLQAKFFRKLQASQWAQIRGSIRQAKDKYPALRKYYVATPVALTPRASRIWENVCRKAAKMRPRLELVWWGESELTHLLTEPVHAGRMAYWFGAPGFTLDWIDRHNAQSRADLDTRYTPERHVRVPVQDALDAFALTASFTRRYYEEAGQVWKVVRNAVEIHEPEKISKDLGVAAEAARAAAARHLPELGDGKVLPVWTEIQRAIKQLHDAIGQLGQIADRVTKEIAAQRSASQPDGTGRTSRDDLGYRRHEISKADERLVAFRQFIETNDSREKRRLLLIGEAGAGKSHLLANFVNEARQRQQCVLFLLGEYFTTAADPWTQLLARLGWHGTVEELLAALNFTAEVSGQPSLLVIDALNETPERDVWLRHLAAFANRLNEYPLVRLLVSCRNDFVRICIPSPIVEGRDPEWAQAEHRGFEDATFTAVARYFAAYRVQARDFPPLLPEFQNPLFLKTFCEAFENRAVPAGPISFERVMEQRVQVACRQIERAIDCPGDTTRRALDIVAALIADHGWHPVPVGITRSAVDALFPGRGRSRSLHQHLGSSGLLAEVGHFDYATKVSDVRVRFAYERFSDYFVARRVLADARSAVALKKIWRAKRYLATWNTVRGYYSNRGLLKALTILLPASHGVELAEWITDSECRRFVLEDFLESLPWRSGTSFTNRSKDMYGAAAGSVSHLQILRTLLRLASVPDHPWNARFLHERLQVLPLCRRELVWTVPLSQMMAEEGRRSVPTSFVRWVFSIDPQAVSEEQSDLVGTLLCWFLSSNDRGFRRRATLAAIRLLQPRAEIAARLVDRFYDVDDPYVVERVMAIAAGVAVRERDPAKLGPLAAVVWRRVFAPRWVRAHILLRDFAFTVLESARERGCLPPGVKPDDYRPPYRSRWPKIWPEKKSRAWGKKEGWGPIVHSIEPEHGLGLYGDFGRYVMQAHMHDWLKVPRTKPYPADTRELGFDRFVARAWVLQRVAGLGWTPERFGQYEQHLRVGRHSHDVEETKQERISKKYQWIALNELEAFASDHFHLGNRWGNGPRKFEGAWQLFSRNFDPAQPLRDPAADEMSETSGNAVVGFPSDWWRRYPDPFRDVALVRQPSAWVRTVPDDPGTLIVLPTAPGIAGEAFVLNGWFSWDEPEPYPPRKPGDGQAHQFIHVRSWLVPKAELAARLRFLRKTHFWGDGVRLPEFGSEGLGEYPWSNRFEGTRQACASNDRWGADFPPGFIHTTANYSEGDACASVPSPQLAELLGVKWSGHDFEFVDKTGKRVAFSPRQPPRSSTPPCIVERTAMLAALADKSQTLVWAIVGERNCFDHFASHSVADSIVTFSGVYCLDKKVNVRGGLTIREVTRIPGGNPATRRRRRAASVTD